MVDAVTKLATSFDYQAQEYLYNLTRDENAINIALSFLLSNKYVLNYSSSYSNEILQYITDVRGPSSCCIWDNIQLDENTSRHLGHITSILFKEHMHIVLCFDDAKLIALIDTLVTIWQLQSTISLVTQSCFADNATDDHITRVISMIIFKKPQLLTHFINILNTPEVTDKYVADFSMKFKLRNCDRDDIYVTRYRHMIVYVLAQVLENFVSSNVTDKISFLPINFSDLVILSGNCNNRYLYSCALLIVNSLNFHISEELLHQLLVIVEKSGFDCDILEMWNFAISHLQYLKVDNFMMKSFRLVQNGLIESTNPINIVPVLNGITVYYVNNSSVPTEIVRAYRQLLSVESLDIPIEIGELFAAVRNACTESLITYDKIASFVSQFDIRMISSRLIELCNPNMQCWSWLNVNCCVEEFPTDYDIYIDSMKNVFKDLFFILPEQLLDTIISEILQSVNENTETSLIALICYDCLEVRHALAILDKIKSLFTLKLSSNYDFILTCMFCQSIFVPHLHRIKDILFQRFVINMKISNIWSKRLAKCIAILNDRDSVHSVIECVQYILETSKSKGVLSQNHYPSILSLSNLLDTLPQMPCDVNLTGSNYIFCKCLLALSISTRQLSQILPKIALNLDILYEGDVDNDLFCLSTSDSQAAVNLLMQLYIQNKVTDIPNELHEIRHPGLLMLCNLNENFEQFRMNKCVEFMSTVSQESCCHCAWACIAYASYVIEQKFNFEFSMEMVKVIYRVLPCLIKMVKSKNEPLHWDLDAILEYRINEIHPSIKCLKGTIWNIYYDGTVSVGSDACKYLSLVNKYAPRIIKSLSNPNVLQLVYQISMCTGSIEVIANKIAISL